MITLIVYFIAAFTVWDFGFFMGAGDWGGVTRFLFSFLTFACIASDLSIINDYLESRE